MLGEREVLVIRLEEVYGGLIRSKFFKSTHIDVLPKDRRYESIFLSAPNYAYMLLKFVSHRYSPEIRPLSEKPISWPIQLTQETICEQEVVLGLQPNFHVFQKLNEALVRG